MLKYAFFCLAFLFSFLLTAVQAADSVRVESRNGAPCIVVDGQPVRPRVFYGGPIRRPVQLGTETKVFDFDFSPLADSEGRGTLHFRFGKAPGKIRLDDFSIRDLESGEFIAGPETFESEADLRFWTKWGDLNDGKPVATVGVKDGALEVEILPERAQSPLDFHIYHVANLKLSPSKRYHVHFTLKSDQPREVESAFYRPGNPFFLLAGVSDGKVPNDLFAAQIQMAAEAGAQFVSFGIPSIWEKETGEWDPRTLDLLVRQVLAANPNALLIPRIGMDAPAWWLNQHPDEEMVWHGVTPERLAAKHRKESVSSKLYREAACKALERTVRYLEEHFGPNMAGYHPCGQNTGEWFTQDTWMQGRAWYAKTDLRAWREWLREKYSTDAALQKAWNRTGVTLDSAEVPEFAEWETAMKEPLLTDARLVDFNEFTSVMMTDTVLDFARTIRRATDGKRLTVFFYGYGFEFGPCWNGPAYSAHYALRRLLDSPDVDVICSPQSYWDRKAGGGGQCMLVSESVALAGKMYLLEDDTRTHLTPGNQNFAGVGDGGKTCEETRELLRRNTGECACRNYACWWMDLGSAGWYADPELWLEMKALSKMDEWFIRNPTPYAPEVGVFIDENVMMRISSGRYTRKSIYEQRAPLARMGASYAQHFTEDLTSGTLKKLGRQPKLCVMLHAEFYTPDERVEIERKVGKESLVWVSMDGISTEDLRKEATRRDVHLFADADCNVWANGPFIVLHASQDGPVHVTPKPGFTKMFDEISGQEVSGTVEMKLGETKVIRCR